MRGGSAAITPSARRRSSAWSRRMKRSSGTGSSRTQIGGCSTAGRLVEHHRSTTAGRAPAHRIPCTRVQGYIKRLATSGFAYQASSLVAGFLALFTLPLYTHHLTTTQLGYAETLLTAIILASIVLRFGVGEAFVRFWFDDEDHARRLDLARTATAWTLYASTAAVLVMLPFAAPLSQLLLAHRDPTLMTIGLLGLWAFTNLEM